MKVSVGKKKKKVSVEQYLRRISGSKHLHIFGDFCFVLFCFMFWLHCVGLAVKVLTTGLPENSSSFIWLLPNCSPPVSWKHENKLISHEDLAASTMPGT